MTITREWDMLSEPVVLDLCCGLGGWTEAFLAEGYRCIGFDVEAHNYGHGGYPGELVLRDIRSITGQDLVKEFGVPSCIVASPPCQEFSYMAMPWSKAKEKMRKILADPAEQKRLTDLFNQCFRIQREVSDAAGHYVPMVVENVRGAQRWVGKARWNFGSFYLWGDVPALMPIPGKIRKTPEGSLDTTRKNYNANHQWDGNKMESSPGKVWSDRPPNVAAHREGTKLGGTMNPGAENRWDKNHRSEGYKTVGMNWSDRSKKGQDFTRIAGKQAMEGIKNKDADGYDYPERTFGWKAPKTSSKSNRRKQASAEVAKIPLPLAQWVAKCFKQTRQPEARLR